MLDIYIECQSIYSALTFYYLAHLSFTSVKRTDWRSLTRCSPCKNQQLSPLNRGGSCGNAPIQNQTAWLQSPVFIVLCCPNLKETVLGLDGETILCLNPKHNGKPVCSHLTLCSEGSLVMNMWAPAHKDRPEARQFEVFNSSFDKLRAAFPSGATRTGHGHAEVWLCRGHTVYHLAKCHKGGLSGNLYLKGFRGCSSEIWSSITLICLAFRADI